MLSRHTKPHFFVVLRRRRQFCHQEIEFLLDTIDDLLDFGVLRYSTSQTERRCRFIDRTEGVRTGVIFRDALFAKQTCVACVSSASCHFCHICSLYNLLYTRSPIAIPSADTSPV